MREIFGSGESENRTTYLADRNQRPNQLEGRTRYQTKFSSLALVKPPITSN